MARGRGRFVAGLALALAVAGCSSAPPETEAVVPAGAKLLVDAARQPAEVQEATLDAFVAAAGTKAPRTLVFVDTTVEGDEIAYTIEPVPVHNRRPTVTISCDAKSGFARRVYVAPEASVVIVPATRDRPALARGAGGGRLADSAVNVLAGGRVIFDSAKSFPLRAPAEAFRRE